MVHLNKEALNRYLSNIWEVVNKIHEKKVKKQVRHVREF